MEKRAVLVLALAVLLEACNSPAAKTAGAVGAAPTLIQCDQPTTIESGLTVDQAYAAIPPRRTVWLEGD